MKIFSRIILFSIGILVFSELLFVYAEEVSDLRGKIDSQETEIEKLNSEIQKYENQLAGVSRKKKTLQNAVYSLDLSRKKVLASKRLTENKIYRTSAEIKKLRNTILSHAVNIEKNNIVLAQALRKIYEKESDTLVEIFLNNDSLSEAWYDIASIDQFQTVIQHKLSTLTKKKAELENIKKQSEKEKGILSDQVGELATRKRELDLNKNAKNQLLKKTKNKESNYQALLSSKRNARKAAEKALQAYESKLKFTLNPTSIPSVGKGILHWPLHKVRITQYFGNTRFAKSGAYNGKGHNGVDFGIPWGTSVKAALGGTITATGNTDAFPGCLSFGRWVLINHGNGISTFYAHLSKILVVPGQKVATGQVFAHSGNSGYSTGPHLHFGTYATSGVKVVRIGDIRKTVRCKKARIPVAPWKAYLNPLDYL